MITIAAESPLTPDGRALIAESQAHMEAVFPAGGIFTLTAEEIAGVAGVFLIARDEEGQALGCVALVTRPGYGEVKRLWMRPTARGRGAARDLMQTLEREAHAAGCRLLRLETGPALPAAVALYRALGYRERGPFGDYDPHPDSVFMEKSLPREGHCLCGRIRYRAEGEVIWQLHCHCESCRRASSSPITSFFAVRDGGWRWTGEAPAAYASSPGVTRYFCPTCGSPMGYRPAKGGEMHFYACSQDDPAAFTPEGHDFPEERLPWLHLSDLGDGS